MDIKRFGLAPGKMGCRGNKVGNNLGWYDQTGRKIGWGDLGTDDLKRISELLEDGELFIVLSEHSSFWRFADHNKPNPLMIGSTQSVTPDEESPGIEYVADEARFIIAKGQAYNVCKLSEPYDSDLEVDFYSKERIVLKGINKAQAQEIILQSVASS